MDRIINAMTKSKNIQGFIALTRDSVKAGASGHKMNIISECIFARALTAGVLLGGNLKNEGDKLILSWNCTGPAKKIVIETSSNGEVRGFIEDNNLQLIEKSIDGGTILSEPYIGFGDITVSRYSGLNAEPYHSVSVIESGEIAHDIAVYLDQSLQIQSCINIGLDIAVDGEPNVCGGMLLMAMPGATEDEIKQLFDKFNSIPSFTTLLKCDGMTEDEMIKALLDRFGMEQVFEKPVSFRCHCDSASIGKMLESMTDEMRNEYKDADGHIRAVCQYCGKEYKF